MEVVEHQSNTRGFEDLGFVKSYHTFSFAGYYDPNRIRFGKLRVLNDDYIEPGCGFDMHPHRNMEIISVPIKGSLKHIDSIGNSYVIHENEVQTMSAGSGVLHSEYNNSKTEVANFLQIWIMTEKLNIAPEYHHKKFDPKGRQDQWQLIVSPDGRNSSAKINQNAYLYTTDLKMGNRLWAPEIDSGFGLYFFIIEGHVLVNQRSLKARDGLGMLNYKQPPQLMAKKDSRILFISVPV